MSIFCEPKRSHYKKNVNYSLYYAEKPIYGLRHTVSILHYKVKNYVFSCYNANNTEFMLRFKRDSVILFFGFIAG